MAQTSLGNDSTIDFGLAKDGSGDRAAAARPDLGARLRGDPAGQPRARRRPAGGRARRRRRADPPGERHRQAAALPAAHRVGDAQPAGQHPRRRGVVRRRLRRPRRRGQRPLRRQPRPDRHRRRHGGRPRQHPCRSRRRRLGCHQRRRRRPSRRSSETASTSRSPAAMPATTPRRSSAPGSRCTPAAPRCRAATSPSPPPWDPVRTALPTSSPAPAPTSLCPPACRRSSTATRSSSGRCSRACSSTCTTPRPRCARRRTTARCRSSERTSRPAPTSWATPGPRSSSSSRRTATRAPSGRPRPCSRPRWRTTLGIVGQRTVRRAARLHLQAGAREPRRAHRGGEQRRSRPTRHSTCTRSCRRTRTAPTRIKRSKPSEPSAVVTNASTLTAGASGKFNTVTWTKVTGATGYEVLRATQVGTTPPAASAFRLVSAVGDVATFEDHAATTTVGDAVCGQPEPAGHGLPRRHLGDQDRGRHPGPEAGPGQGVRGQGLRGRTRAGLGDCVGGELPVDLGIPGLSLKTGDSGSVSGKVGWGIDLKIGMSRSKGFYIDTSKKNELAVGAALKLDKAATGPDLQAQLAIINVDVTKNGDKPEFVGSVRHRHQGCRRRPDAGRDRPHPRGRRHRGERGGQGRHRLAPRRHRGRRHAGRLDRLQADLGLGRQHEQDPAATRPA